jgi:hypothetical protein
MRRPFIVCLIRAIALTTLAALVAGCGSEPEFVPVRGKVSYHGQPLPRGTIVFTPDPDRGTSGPQASAEIQPDGSYTLRTGAAFGAIPGWHRVTVLALDAPPAEGTAGGFLVPRSLLPDKYRDPVQSGLVCEVQPGKVNGFNFNLD